ncbi:glycosyltransferase [Allomuricauda sp. d1]|uniref:glycosyltransferase n=1 Tax=Allomuricauda sp. d1 TaxID=3136725 RepID=UPI0031DED135
MNPKPETRNPKLLTIGHTWPEPKTTAAGHRMVQLLEAFADKGFQLFFGSTAAKTKFSADISKFKVKEVPIKLNDSSFDILIKELQPDMVIFDRFMVEEQFGWRVAENVPKAIRILNTEDLHSLRDYREAAVKHEEAFDYGNWLTTDKTKREMASIFRSDLTFVVSDFEEKLLVDRIGVPQSHVLHLPFLSSKLTDEEIQAWPTFGKRKDMVCFGNGKHAPNIDSIYQLKSHIWPKIKKELPDAQLKVFGAYLPESIKQLHNEKEGFLVEGWIDNLDAELQKARLNLAPLRFGAGIKGKLVDAMCNGLPSVTTPIGSEGMHGNLQWAGAICDGPRDFVKAAVALYQKPTQWMSCQRNGVEIVNTIYNAEKLKDGLFGKITAVGSNLDDHRQKNFIGQMLQHQSLNATKFMGKWIEEKHRKK